MLKKLIVFGLLLVTACNSHLDSKNNSVDQGQGALIAAITEARTRGLVGKDSWLLVKPLLDKGDFTDELQIPEKIGGISVKPIEWV